jgi:hypothetical protein
MKNAGLQEGTANHKENYFGNIVHLFVAGRIVRYKSVN